MIRTGIIGLGKMGISHLAILGAHPDVQVVGICDTSKMVLDALGKYSSFKGYTDYKKMVEETRPEAVVISVPTRFHAVMVEEMLQKNIHVFSEKPFCLTPEQGKPLVEMAAQRGLVNQVGYHNKFIGTFREVKKILNEGWLGDIYHFTGEAYGPVVVRSKDDTWRSNPEEGGGCLMDYASHVIDLLNDLLAPVSRVKSSTLKSVYSKQVDDAVYAILELSNKVTGVLSVNWSDETYRKMSTSVSCIGTRGKIISDANELKVYFKQDCPPGYSKGWNVRYITDLTEEVDFYLRGEEYSLQLDHFIKTIQGKERNNINSFQSAWHTDNAIALIKQAQN